MNLRWSENSVIRQALLGFFLILFLAIVAYIFALIQPSVSGLELFARANSTRTSIALTSQALYGPFPTATGPTPTPSRTPTITPTITITPTSTPTPTPIRYFIDTATPRTLVPGSGLTSTALAPTQPRGTSTPLPPSNPTNPPRPTNPPQPTNPPPQATNPPRPTRPPQPTNEPRPTREPKPTKVPKPTKTPKR